MSREDKRTSKKQWQKKNSENDKNRHRPKRHAPSKRLRRDDDEHVVRFDDLLSEDEVDDSDDESESDLDDAIER